MSDKMLPYDLSYGDYSMVYNATSFVMASMGASTVYFFFHAHLVQKRYRTALCISALVTLIAFYHYFRIFNSWVEAYEFDDNINAKTTEYKLHATGKPFNDAYRYMDWLLTVPLLLLELVLVMDLSEEDTSKYSWRLGTAAAVMILLGYPGEISNSHSTRWIFWFMAICPFIYIVITLFSGLSDAVANQPPAARALVSSARWVTVLSWLTYPFVYVIPMLGVSREQSLVGVQVGYSCSDFISKCGLGLMITMIALRKSATADGQFTGTSYQNIDNN